MSSIIQVPEINHETVEVINSTVSKSFFKNPLTNRFIQFNGTVFKNLVKKNIIDINGNLILKTINKKKITQLTYDVKIEIFKNTCDIKTFINLLRSSKDFYDVFNENKALISIYVLSNIRHYQKNRMTGYFDCVKYKESKNQ